jgi:glycosyltransferase 2 family protein
LKHLNISLKITFSLLFVFLIYKGLDVENIPFQRINLSAPILLQIIGVLFLSVYLRAYRWRILANMHIGEGNKIGIIVSLKYLLIGSTLNIFLPSGAGDVVKGYFAGKEQGNANQMYNASIYDKLIAISSLFFISIYGFYYSGNYWVLLAGVLSFTPLLIMLSSKFIMNIKWTIKLLGKTKNRMIHKLANFLQRGFHISFKKFILTTGISILAWLCTYYLLFLCFETVALIISLEDVMTNSPMITLGRLFPFTLSGIGSDEALIIYLFKSVTSSVEVILVGALLYRIVVIIIPGIIGVPLVLKFKKRSND